MLWEVERAGRSWYAAELWLADGRVWQPSSALGGWWVTGCPTPTARREASCLAAHRRIVDAFCFFAGLRLVVAGIEDMSRKSQRKASRMSRPKSKRSRRPIGPREAHSPQPFYQLIGRGLNWVLVALVIPVIIGLVVLGAELLSEKPALSISSTEMPETDCLVFYRALFENDIVYTSDRWNVRVEGLPPFNDPNPIFGLSDLPALEIPITLVNTGRKPTTAKRFRLTIHTSAALVSEAGVIIDSTGRPSEQQNVFVDIGQEQTIIVRFPLSRLEEGLREPEYTGYTLAHEILFRGMMRLEIVDVEQRTSSAVIEIGQAKVDGEHSLFYWVTSWDGHRGEMPASIAFGQGSDFSLETNPYIVEAYVKAGSAYIEHDCLDCALAYLNHALQVDPNNIDGYYYRGIAYKGLGKLESAKADFETCIGLGEEAYCAQELEDLLR